jgi:hypothetical protein
MYLYWYSTVIPYHFVSLTYPSVVVIVHNVIQINLQLLKTLISLLSEGNSVGFIYGGIY